MDQGDFLGPQPIVVKLRAKDRWEAIDELVNALVARGKIKAEQRDAIAAAVIRRERSMSTGIGFGIAVPHASTDLIGELVGVVGRSRQGVQFDSLDGQPVKLVLLFLVPRGQFHKHRHTLVNVAKLLHRKDFRDGLGENLE
jgi:mannitol/fructose-specific phosphotransferase system IIA component (Ntr-type)